VQAGTGGVKAAEPLLGAGVYYGAALSEAASYRGRDVIVVGGGRCISTTSRRRSIVSPNCSRAREVQ
jgi:hypothetical protein